MVLNFELETKRVIATKITSLITEASGAYAAVPTDEVLETTPLADLKSILSSFSEGRVLVEKEY